MGTYTLINGVFAPWYTQTAASIGEYGEGVFTQVAGDTHYYELRIGTYTGSNGIYYMNGGSLLSSDAFVGAGGSGTLFQNGGSSQVEELSVGTYQGSEGTYVLNDGQLSVNMESIGGWEWREGTALTGTGTFTQIGGTHTVSMALEIGVNEGTTGTFNLEGGELTAKELRVAGNKMLDTAGTGFFTQSGGTVTISSFLGVGLDGIGTYRLIDGELSTPEIWIGEGHDGIGSFIQEGATYTTTSIVMGTSRYTAGSYILSGGQLMAAVESIGGEWWNNGKSTPGVRYSGGEGTVTQTGGINICTNLYMGNTNDATGTYDLSDGQLSTEYEYLGCGDSSATFSQSGGVHTVLSDIYLAYAPEATGAFNLSGGELSANNEYVGYSTGIGTFTQNGGINTVLSSLYIGYVSGSKGTYTLQSGQLNVGGALRVGADGGGTGTLNWFGGSIDAASVVLGAKSTLVMGHNFSVDDVVGGSAFGGATVNISSSVTLTLMNGATATHGLASTLAVGQLHIGYGGDSGTYALVNGQLSVAKEYVEVGSIFIQDGGVHTVTSELHMGGIYNFNRGQLSTASENVSGGGVLTQSDGTHTVSVHLYIGPSSSGTYNLNGGTLSATEEDIGHSGTGTLTQNGGSNGVTSLRIGVGSTGTYNLVGGTLSGTNEYLGELGWGFPVAIAGAGTVTQSGGTNTVSVNLYLGYTNNSTGTYNLDGGQLSSPNEYIGGSGATGTIITGIGAFTQNGGINTVSSYLYLGYNQGSMGTYNLNDGQLTALYEYVGKGGTGFFVQEGGINSCGRLDIGTGVNAVYTFHGGQLKAWNIHVGSGGYFENSGGPEERVITATNSFLNDSTLNELFRLYDTRVVLWGGISTKAVALKMNSVDMGATPEGYVNNFALGELIFRGSTTGHFYYKLTSDVYTRGLVIEDGAVVNLNGFHIYYTPMSVSSHYLGGTWTNGEILPVTFIPEAGTIAMVVTAVLGLAGAMRRRR